MGSPRGLVELLLDCDRPIVEVSQKSDYLLRSSFNVSRSIVFASDNAERIGRHGGLETPDLYRLNFVVQTLKPL